MYSKYYGILGLSDCNCVKLNYQCVELWLPTLVIKLVILLKRLGNLPPQCTLGNRRLIKFILINNEIGKQGALVLIIDPKNISLAHPAVSRRHKNGKLFCLTSQDGTKCELNGQVVHERADFFLQNFLIEIKFGFRT